MPVTNAASGIKAGTVAHFAASSAPPGWLKCNGAAVSRTAYEALFLAIGTNYGAGDGSTTFNVPDLRGEFVRGLDDGRGVDSGRAIGTSQAGQNQQHRHRLKTETFSGASSASSLNTTGVRQLGGYSAEGTNGYQDLNSDSVPWVENQGGSENRPRNVAMLACIKF